MKKQKLRNKIFTIVLISLIALALIGLLIGYCLIGYDVIGWFSSRWAIWVYTGVIIFGVIWISLYIWDKIKEL